MKPTIWRRAYEWLGEVFFAKELDKTHDRAFRAGVAHALAKTKFDVETKMLTLQMTKKELEGYQRCMNQIEITRTKLTYTTGARL